MPIGAWIAIALVVIAGIVLFAVSRLSGQISEEEARGDYQEGQKEAIKADQERANEIEDRAAKAASAKPAAGSLAERLHRSGRGREAKK